MDVERDASDPDMPGAPDDGGTSKSPRRPREIDGLTARVEGLDIQASGLLGALRAMMIILVIILLAIGMLYMSRRKLWGRLNNLRVAPEPAAAAAV